MVILQNMWSRLEYIHMERIDADSAAATPLDPRVRCAMERAAEACAGNPGSIHKEGERAHEELERARRSIARLIGARPHEIIFTGGGTEGNNLALFGIAYGKERFGGSIVTSAIEHSSVQEPLRELQRRGCTLTELPCDIEGRMGVEQILKALNPHTFLISIHLANNEIGTIQPIREIAEAVKRYRREHASVYPYLHTDACQAPRTLSTMAETLGVDAMTISGAKIYGPRGVGFLYVREGTNLAPLFYGGGQEYGLRAGTEDVLACVGLAEALAVCAELRNEERERLTQLRDELIDALLALPGAVLNGSCGRERLPQNVHVSFKHIAGERMVVELDRRGIAAATGSACSARTKSASHVIRALVPPEAPWRAEGALRLSLGRDATHAQVRMIADTISDILDACTHFYR